MKLNFPKIIREIDLSEYDPAWGGQVVYLWVNPPSSSLNKINECIEKIIAGNKEAEEEYLLFLSELLSCGEDNTHFSVDDLKEIEQASRETDPLFFGWLQARITKEIGDYRLGRKKK